VMRDTPDATARPAALPVGLDSLVRRARQRRQTI
jgi:hypothetical protein